MSRARYFEVATDTAGRPLAGVTVNVYQVGTTTPIAETIYSAASGGATLTNPLTANAQGEIEFWLAEPAEVDLRWSKAGSAAETHTVGVLAPLPTGSYETTAGATSKVAAEAVLRTAADAAHAASGTAHSGTTVMLTGDQSVAGVKTFRDMVNIRKTGGDTGDSPVVRAAGDTSAGNIQMRHEGDYGYLIHLTMGAGTVSPWSAIGIGNDFGTGSAILIANKNTGTGIKILQYAAIASATAYGIYLNQQSALASGVFLEQAAVGAAPCLDVVGNVTQAGDKLIRIRHATNGEFGFVDSNAGDLTWNRIINLTPTGATAMQIASNKAISIRNNANGAYRQALIQDTADKIILGDQNSTGAVAVRAGGTTAITLETNGSTRLTVDSQGLTVQDGKSIFATGVTGLKFGALSTHYQSWWGATPVQQIGSTPAASATQSAGYVQADVQGIATLVNFLRSTLLTYGLIA